MKKTSPSLRIEIEINRLLKLGKSLQSIIVELVKIYANANLTRAELEAISVFFLYSGQYATLSEFLAKSAAQGLQIPWAHFTETLFLSTPAIPATIKDAIIKGATHQNQLSELTRTTMLDSYEERLLEIRKKRRSSIQEGYLKLRAELLLDLDTLRTQGLEQAEEELIKKLLILFPTDLEIQQLASEQKKRKVAALFQSGALSKINANRGKSRIPIELYEELSPEMQSTRKIISNSMSEKLVENPELEHEFAVAQIVLENFESALALIDPIKLEKKAQWLRLEVLLRLRRFFEILNLLPILEKHWASEPESIFALNYIKAQALWGLGKEKEAIDLIENIVIARPSYRNARSLLTEWSTGTA